MTRQFTLADGQVAASATAVFAGSSLGGQWPTGTRVTIHFSNTNTTAETVTITFKRAGGTARQITKPALAQNETLVLENIAIQPDDTILAATTTASKVDYVVQAGTGGAFRIYVLDANGGLKSGAASVSGALTLSGDLTAKNDAGTSHLIWDASAVSTLWANAPSSLNPDPSIYHVVWDDFNLPASATASDTMAWVSVDDSSTGTNAFQDVAGGVYNVVTAAADNDYHAMRTFNKSFFLLEGKKLWFEARFKLSEATTNESAWWFGLTDTVTTGGFQANAAGPLASYDGALIWKDEATMSIDFETSNAGTQNTAAAEATFVTNTWTRVGFYFDGVATTSSVTPYYDVDGNGLVAGTAQDITLSGLAATYGIFGLKSGPTAAAETLQVDYVKILQLR